MYKIFLSAFLLIFFFHCKQSTPCSPFDSSCNPLGYFLPDLIKPNKGNVTFGGLNFLTILSSTSVRLDWTAATSTATGSIEYNIYSSTTSGAQVFTTPLQTVTNVTTATITGITAGTNNYYIVRAKNSAGVTDTNTSERAALLNGLIRYIPLDSSSLATGEKIGNTVVTAFGSPPLTGTDRRGITNNAYLLDGTNHYFTFSDTGLPAGNTDRTICVWAKFNSANSAVRLFTYGNDTTDQIASLRYTVTPNAILSFSFFNGTATSTNLLAGELNLGNWNFFCVMLKSPTFSSIFVNGVPRLLNQSSGNVNTTLGIMPATIASHNNGFGEKLPGLISDVSVWNRALTASELQAVFRN